MKSIPFVKRPSLPLPQGLRAKIHGKAPMWIGIGLLVIALVSYFYKKHVDKLDEKAVQGHRLSAVWNDLLEVPNDGRSVHAIEFAPKTNEWFALDTLGLDGEFFCKWSVKNTNVDVRWLRSGMLRYLFPTSQELSIQEYEFYSKKSDDNCQMRVWGSRGTVTVYFSQGGFP